MAWQPTPIFVPGESPWTEEPGGLQSTGSGRVGHNWATKPSTELFCYWCSVGTSPFSLRLINSICCSKCKCFKFLFQLWKFKHNSINWNPKAFCTSLKFSLKWSEIVQSCPTLGNPMDCNLPGSSIHGIFQARVLEWVSIFFSRGILLTQGSNPVSRIAVRLFTVWATREAPKAPEILFRKLFSIIHD